MIFLIKTIIERKKMKSKGIIIGDQHFKISNIPEVEEYIEKICNIVKEECPDFIVLLGDMLDQHEKIHTTPLNKAYDFIDRMRKITKTFVIVGNHDMSSNQVFLTDEHWLNGLKEWENVIVVDKVIVHSINNIELVFCPYVFAGRFEEALNTIENYDWKNAKCIFCHQEFEGCKMGAISSIEGDRWDLKNPNIISGHIHKNQTINNIYYPGSSMQVSFGETDKNIISSVEFEINNEGYKLREIEIDLPRKKIVYVDVDEFNNFNVDKTKDKLKLTVSGSYEEFKTLKKTKKYKEIIDEGVQVVFKSKKKEMKRIKEHLSEQIENQKNNNDDDNFNMASSFQNILNDFIKKEKNPYLFETYELVINNKLVKTDDVIYL